MRLRGLYKFPDGGALGMGKTGLTVVGSKTLIQLSADVWGCASSLLVIWPEMTQPWGLWLYGRVNGNLQEGLS